MSLEIEADASGSTPLEASSASGAGTGASASPFTLLPGAAGAMVCEGDVCYVPGPSAE